MRIARLIALCLAQMVASAAWAERGVVKTTNGLTYEGDVKETPTQVIITRNKTELQVSREDVASIRYLSSDAEEIKAEWSKLGKEDANGRVALARQAFERGQYELARSIADEATKIDPNNRDAFDLLDIIRRQIVMETRATRGRQEAAEAVRSPYALPESYMDERDINAVRQAELQPRDERRVRVRFDNDARRRFVLENQYNANRFSGFSAFQQAMAIIREGSPEVRRDVIILDDPATITEFRAVQRNILTGCASQVCHGSLLGGNFILFPNIERDAATYTNFYLLMKYSRTSQEPKQDELFGGNATQQPMINRQRPQQSLLLQYSLPQNTADIPHPQVPGFRPMFPRPNEPVYFRTLDWIANGLRRVDVRYDVQYQSPIEQMVHPASQPATGPSTQQSQARPAAVVPVAAPARR